MMFSAFRATSARSLREHPEIGDDAFVVAEKAIGEIKLGGRAAFYSSLIDTHRVRSFACSSYRSRSRGLSFG